MKLKKLFAVLLVCALVFTGCSSKEDNGGSDGEKVTLTVWGPQEDQDTTKGNWLKKMCDEFAALHPEWNITFVYGTCAESQAGEMVTQDPTAAADVYMFANDQLGALIDAKAISKLGGDTLTEIKANNSEEMVDSVTQDGSVYGIPFTANTWFMYYDTSVFSEEDIKSLDTMLSKAVISFPISDAWYNAAFYVANGGTLFGEDGTDGSAGIDFGGDKGYQATEYLVNLMANKNFVNDADGSGIAGLRDGSIKAMFSGSWVYEDVKEALGDNFGAAQLPTITINGESKQLRSFFGSKSIAVNPNSKNSEVAVALARYLGGEAAQKAHYELRSIIPCNTALLEDATIAADPVVTAQNDTVANTSILQPSISEMTPYWDAATIFGKAIVGGQITSANYKEKLDAYVVSLNTPEAE